MKNRTVQALRQSVYAALTSPPLQYQVNNASPVALPAANVIPKEVWLAGGAQAPMPLVCYVVSSIGNPSRTISDRQLMLKVWCVSSAGTDECTELYEAVRSVLHTADQDGPAKSLSRAATATTLPIAVALCVERRAPGVAFEEKTQRWYCVGEYDVIAN